jgi:hypothetical protein
MNLHEIVSGAINAVNPFQSITITPKSGYTVNEYGEAVPTSGVSYTMDAQVQPVSSEDLRFINNYNESTVYLAFWISADVHSLNRPLARGGDIVSYNGKTYKVVNMPENWYNTAGWSHFVAALQLGGSNANTNT